MILRRKDKQINDRKLIEKILDTALVCRIAMCKDNVPYLVTMNYAYTDNCLFLHSAQKGQKIDILKSNPRVCFEIDHGKKLLPSKIPCENTMQFISLIGTGSVIFLNDEDEKSKVLSLLLKKYTHMDQYEFSVHQLRKVLTFKICIDSITGKQSVQKDTLDRI